MISTNLSDDLQKGLDEKHYVKQEMNIDKMRKHMLKEVKKWKLLQDKVVYDTSTGINTQFAKLIKENPSITSFWASVTISRAVVWSDGWKSLTKPSDVLTEAFLEIGQNGLTFDEKIDICKIYAVDKLSLCVTSQFWQDVCKSFVEDETRISKWLRLNLFNPDSLWYFIKCVWNDKYYTQAGVLHDEQYTREVNKLCVLYTFMFMLLKCLCWLDVFVCVSVR